MEYLAISSVTLNDTIKCHRYGKTLVADGLAPLALREQQVESWPSFGILYVVIVTVYLIHACFSTVYFVAGWFQSFNIVDNRIFVNFILDITEKI